MLKDRAAGAIVKCRIPLMILMLVLSAAVAPNIQKTVINYSLTDYLSDDTLTKRGLAIMNSEFETSASMTLGLPGTAGEGEALAGFLSFAEGLPGVLTVSSGPAAEENGVRFTRVSLLMSEAAAETVYDRVEEYLASVPHLSASAVRDNRAIQKSLNDEMPAVMGVSCLIVLAVLLLLSKSWLEPLVFFIDIGVSVLLNMGTNAIFPRISFITFAVTAILQLALSMDYSIMLINAYDVRLDEGLSPAEAMKKALAASFMPVASSALTTVAGMISLVFMSFTIGYDIGLVLAKGIVLSMLSVFLLMPGLLTLMTPLLKKTRHRQLHLRAEKLVELPGRARAVLSAALLILIVISAFLQAGNVYTYTVSDVDSDSARLAALFGRSNQMVLLFPRCADDASYARQKDALARIGDLTLNGKPAVRSVLAMPVTGEMALTYYDAESLARLMNVPSRSAQAVLSLLGVSGPVRGDKLIDRVLNAGPLVSAMFPSDLKARLTEARDLLSAAEASFNGENWSRAILEMDLSYTDVGAPELLGNIRGIMREFYGEDWAMAGHLTATDDIATSFSGDVRRVSLITVLALFLIVLLSFRNAAVPVILVCVIQGAVWINMAFSGLIDGSVFFMCYLICMALQMGATIDYGILLTSHYREARATLAPLPAAAEALRRSMQTIFTSGLALITAGFAVGIISSLFYISSIGTMLGRGAIVSVLLVILLLPQLLVWLDRFVMAEREAAPVDVRSGQP